MSEAEIKPTELGGIFIETLKGAIQSGDTALLHEALEIITKAIYKKVNGFDHDGRNDKLDIELQNKLKFQSEDLLPNGNNNWYFESGTAATRMFFTKGENSIILTYRKPWDSEHAEKYWNEFSKIFGSDHIDIPLSKK